MYLLRGPKNSLNDHFIAGNLMQCFQGRKKAKRAHLMAVLRVHHEVGGGPNKRAWEHILDILVLSLSIIYALERKSGQSECEAHGDGVWGMRAK